MRVVAGELRGRMLSAPKGNLLRPTADRVKEALFNILLESIQGTRFLDLFAGTGNVGIEAISRGAQHAVFVETNPFHLNVLRRNVERCGIKEKTTIVMADATSFIKQAERRNDSFGIIFMDPPYFDRTLEEVLENPGLPRLLERGGWLIVEHFHKILLMDHYRLIKKEREYHYGDSILSFFQAGS
jgi:16S rRNA (guanine(966)-N(2))-methyltransferase RsmD